MDVALKHIDEDREIVEIALPSIHGSQGNEGETGNAPWQLHELTLRLRRPKEDWGARVHRYLHDS